VDTTTPLPATDVDPRSFRSALGRFATGVAAVTGLHDNKPVGLTVSSFSAVSLVPPLVSFCVAHTSASWPRLRNTARLCVNILAESQHAVCRRLASPHPDKFRGLRWSLSPGRAPVLDGVIAWLECTVEAEYTAGDHDIVVARVRDLRTIGPSRPLVYHAGTFGRFTPALPS
jgi:flavin reductase (DIM6/NTAB) family NADH-FMN oxidoreductase RutF